MKELENVIDKEELGAMLRYFKILLRVLKRIKDESRGDPSILDHLEPEFRFFILNN